jgi:hypothetical protein
LLFKEKFLAAYFLTAMVAKIFAQSSGRIEMFFSQNRKGAKGFYFVNLCAAASLRDFSFVKP